MHVTSRNCYLDLGLPSRFVADLWSLGVHVYISFVFHLATEHLCPSLKTSLKAHSQDTFNLRGKTISMCFNIKRVKYTDY